MIKVEYDEETSRISIESEKISISRTFPNLMKSEVCFIQKIVNLAFCEGAESRINKSDYENAKKLLKHINLLHRHKGYEEIKNIFGKHITLSDSECKKLSRESTYSFYAIRRIFNEKD